ncbi:MAG TPA: class I SAM-dependent methyltransferase [Myxococcota bacterium]|jgi:2-polyprenyl-3-methyl-5-hydroxy-6-metoxy-1,4-benzoquinol methylase|nr:class I SAM-dependent methyltransferase [Myxococcota bacterium]
MDGPIAARRAGRGFRDVPIASVRDFWNARPCNLRHSREPVGTRAYFDQVEARKYFVEPHIPRFAEFERWRGRRVLEIGCGIGTDTVSFARAGATVTAVDLSERSLALARQRIAVCGLEGVRFVEADVERLGEALPAEPYDLVYSFGVLHHTPDPDAALRALRPYVAPGGTLKLMVYHRRSWKVLSILARAALARGPQAFLDARRLVARYSEAQTGCPVTYSYSRREARAWLARAGFRVEEIEVDHIFPWRVADYVEHRYRREPWLALLPPAVFRALERRLGWHLLLTARAD